MRPHSCKVAAVTLVLPKRLVLVGTLVLAGLTGIGPAAARHVITTFDPPGSTGTFANSINDAGTIVGAKALSPGTYYDSNYVPHGFLRSR